jgi:hypothetical protein
MGLLMNNPIMRYFLERDTIHIEQYHSAEPVHGSALISTRAAPHPGYAGLACRKGDYQTHKGFIMSSSRPCFFVVWALLCLISRLAYATIPQPSMPVGKPTEQAHLVADYGKLPLSFEANQGQTAEEVKFIARGPGYALFLKPDEAVLTLTNLKKRGVSGKLRPRQPNLAGVDGAMLKANL